LQEIVVLTSKLITQLGLILTSKTDHFFPLVLRQHHLANRYFIGYESIVDAVCDAWNDFVSDGKRVIEMFTRDGMILTN